MGLTASSARLAPSRHAGILNIRNALARPRLRQSHAALKAAAQMALLLPVAQALLLVGVLNAEPWIALLCVEGLLIGSLAASQLKRARAESRAVGFGAALLNAVLLGVLGVFLGSHVFWILGVIAMPPISVLALLPTEQGTVRRAWLAYLLGMALAFAPAVAGRVCLALAPATGDPGARELQLAAAWGAFIVRGGNGTERALLRLRQAQAAFEGGQYERAFEYAHDGLMAPDGRMRELAASALAPELLKSLLMVKAQARYNGHWDKDDPAPASVGPQPLDVSILSGKDAAVRWGY